MDHRHRHVRTALSLLLLLASGCATTGLSPINGRAPGEAVVAVGASGLKQARISYRRAATTEGDATARLASYTPLPVEKAPAQVLTIEYPHPNGDRNLARASLVTTSEKHARRGEKGGGDRRARRGWLARVRRWTDRSLPGLSLDENSGIARSLVVSKSEVDALLRTIAAEEVLTAGAAGPARLDLEVNGAAQSRSTAPLPPLDKLAARIAAEGQVLSADDPLVQDRLAELAPSHDRFYENLQASLRAE